MQQSQQSIQELLQKNKDEGKLVNEERRVSEELKVSLVNKENEYKSLLEKNEHEREGLEVKYKILCDELESGKQTLIEQVRINEELKASFVSKEDDFNTIVRINEELKASLTNKENELNSIMAQNKEREQSSSKKLEEIQILLEEQRKENQNLTLKINLYETEIVEKNATIEKTNEENSHLNEEIKNILNSKEKEIENFKMKWTKKKETIATYLHKSVMVNDDIGPTSENKSKIDSVNIESHKKIL